MEREGNLIVLLEKFRDQQDVMTSTRKQYYNVIRLFFAWVLSNGYNWEDLNISHIIKFKEILYHEQKTVRTIRFYLIIIKIFYKWIASNGIDKNIAAPIKLPKRENTFTKKALTADQAKELLESINRNTTIGKRNYALFRFLFTTGLRSVSTESLNIGDIKNYLGENVIWYKNKGSRNKNHFKPLTANTIDAIEDYLLNREGFQDHWPLFATHSQGSKGKRLSRCTMRIIFKNQLKRIGINDPMITLHSTRHTHGVICIKTTGAYETQLSLNHNSAQTTRIYNHHADEEIIMQNRTGKAVDELLS